MTSSARSLLRALRQGRPEQPAWGSAAENSWRRPEPIIPVLLASALESDRLALQNLLKDTPYVLVHAGNWNTALNLAGHIVFPVILYDRLFDTADWQLAVRRLASSWRSPSVLLLSEAREHGLRNEVIFCGGVDILVRPLAASDVLQTMDYALAYFARQTGNPQPNDSARMGFQVLR